MKTRLTIIALIVVALAVYELLPFSYVNAGDVFISIRHIGIIISDDDGWDFNWVTGDGTWELMFNL